MPFIIYNKKYINKHWKPEQGNKFKIVKFQLQDNTWRTYNKPSLSRLKRLILTYQPKNIYCSISEWLNFKEHNTYLNILLNSDFIVDFDTLPKRGIINKINKDLHKQGLYLKFEVNSGGGKHLIYEHKRKSIENPQKRLDFYKKEKERLTNILKNRGIDTQVSKDIFRVSRIFPSWNSNKGKICYTQGMKAETMFSVSRMTNGEAIGNENSLNSFPPSKALSKKPSLSKVFAHYFYNFISNSIPKTKGLYVPLIKWQFMRKKLLKKTLRHYEIGSFLTIKTPKNLYFMGFRAFNKRKIEKIYRFSKSNSLLEFQKYGYNWIPIKDCGSFPIEMAFFGQKGAEGNYSKPHLNFFGVNIDGLKCGNGNLKVWKAERSNTGQEKWLKN